MKRLTLLLITMLVGTMTFAQDEASVRREMRTLREGAQKVVTPRVPLAKAEPGSLFSVKSKDVDIWFEASNDGKTCLVAAKDGGTAVSKSITGKVIIPAVADGLIVNGIADGAFSGCTGLTRIELPYTIFTIGSKAFEGCSGMTAIELPVGVNSIGEGAFAFCSGLKKLTVNSGTPLTIDSNVFTSTPGAINLKTITLYVPKGAKSAYSVANVWKEFAIEETEAFDSNMIIDFADATVKKICIENWDTNKDGELTCGEAAAVTTLGRVFSNTDVRYDITSFNELRYFTGLKELTGNCFNYCYRLQSITLPRSITTIGNYAFSRCYQLKSINIPSDVKSIDGSAFYECEALSEYVIDSANPYYMAVDNCLVRKDTKTLVRGTGAGKIPEGIEIIGNHAFSGLYDLQSINIPEGVKQIGENVFDECYHLTSITIPASVTKIDGKLFYYCDNLNTVTVKSGNTVYDSRDDCNAIIETASNTLVAACPMTVIPDGVAAIGSGAFFGCRNMEVLLIPKSVTSIANYAFSSSAIKTVRVEWTEPVSIREYSDVFSGSTLYVPEGTVETYKAADGWKTFGSIKDREGDAVGDAFSVTLDDGVTMWFRILSIGENNKTCEAARLLPGGDWTRCIDDEHYWNVNVVSVPSEVNGYKVTRIGQEAFYYCYNLKTISLPNTIESIGNDAFYYCQNLATIEIPASVTSVGRNLFRYCRSLNSLTVAKGNEVYDSRNNCNAIIKTDENKLVVGCNVTVIPNDVTSIGGYAFFGQDRIEKIVIPNSVTTMEMETFWNCSNLKELVLSENLTVIPSYMIENCVNLKELKIPESVRTIENSAFYKSSLVSIEIPSGVDNIMNSPFNYCSSLSVITVAERNKKYYSIGNNAILEKESGRLVSMLHRGATLTIPDGVKKIDSEFFSSDYSVISSVVLPSSISMIDWWTFGNCTGLSSVTILNPTPSEVTAYQNSFGENSQNRVTLYVPESSVESYQESSLSSLFKEVKAIPEVRGDLSGTGSVEAQDVVLWVDKFITNDIPTDKTSSEFKKFDVNGDDKIDVSDLTSIVYLACGYDAHGNWMGASASRSFMSMGSGTLVLKTLSSDSNSNSMELVLESPEDYTAFQMDIMLPQDADIKVTMGERGNGLKLVTNRLADGRLRVLGFSGSNQPMEAGVGRLLNIDVKGTRSIDFSDVYFSTVRATSVGYTVVDQTTGISTINTDEPDTEVFDLNGQHKEKLHKGLNILRDGKGSVRKVFVK